MRTKKTLKWIIPAMLILAAAFSRLIPHPYNFSSIAGMALLGGATFTNKKCAFILPLAALFLSDLYFQLFTGVAGFYGWSQLINYVAFALIVVLGMVIIRKINAQNVLFASLAASALFFIISNFGVWLTAGGVAPYSYNGVGLLNTYILGIPFLGNTILGDLLYTGVLFGIYSLIQYLVFPRKRLLR